MDRSCLFIFFAIFVLILIIVLDFVYKQQLQDSSAQLTDTLQCISCFFKDWIIENVDEASMCLVCLIPILSFFIDGYQSGIPLVTAAAAGIGLEAVWKMTYIDPYPHLGNAGALILCAKGWRSTSNRAYMTGVVYGLYAYDSYLRHRKPLVAAMVVFILVVGFNQLYLGANFYNQVFIAWALAGISGAMIVLSHLDKLDNSGIYACGSHIFACIVLVLCTLGHKYSYLRWGDRQSSEGIEDSNLKNLLLYEFPELPIVCVLPGFFFGVFKSRGEYLLIDQIWNRDRKRSLLCRLIIGVGIFIGCFVANYLVTIPYNGRKGVLLDQSDLMQGEIGIGLVLGFISYICGFLLGYYFPHLYRMQNRGGLLEPILRHT